MIEHTETGGKGSLDVEEEKGGVSSLFQRLNKELRYLLYKSVGTRLVALSHP